MVTIEKDLAIELIDLKLRVIKQDILDILNKWGYKSTVQFLADSRDGTIQEAEDDAITLQHLIDQTESLFALKRGWSLR